MSIAKIEDVCHVRFSAPDLDEMARFLDDFGMVVTSPADDRLHMRGYGSAPFVHMTQQGPAGFVAFGMRVKDRADLEALSAHEGVAITPFDAPGGGEVVRLTDPDGFVVEVVHGQTQIAPLPTPIPLTWNEASNPQRIGELRRIPSGPSHVLRLGHVVLGVRNFRVSEAWYKERFGFITSDEIQPVPGVGIGAFMRADRGEISCDHHTLFLLEHPAAPTYLHAAFEVVDLDDLMAGRDHLLKQEYNAVWGVGRHVLGSQVFDYWNDPWGHEIEHWTDGDQLRASDGSGVAPLEALLSVQWGMAFPGPQPS